jgi:drug/metabolite transporter (DMT)-like permease
MQTNPTNNKIAYFYALSASILWASTAAVGKLLLAGMRNVQILPFITLFAALSLFILAAAQNKTRIINTYAPKDYLSFAFMGFLGVFLYSFFLYAALSKLRAQEAFIINYLWPVMVIIFARLILKENLTWKKILAIALAFLGVVVVISGGNFVGFEFADAAGIAAAVAGAIAYGLFSVLGKRNNHEILTSMAFFHLFGFCCALAVMLVFSEFPALSYAQLLGLIWLGVFAGGIPFALWFLALKLGDTSKMANFIYLTPFFSLVYIWVLTGETIKLASIAGLLLIVGGILAQSWLAKGEGDRY